LRFAVAVVAVGAVCAAAAALPPAAAAKAPVTVYRGLGTWVDMYDTSAWDNPKAVVANIARHHVRTLFLETSNYHWPTGLNRPSAMAAFIEECHRRKIHVVAWYVPGFTRPATDYARSMAAIRYRTPHGQRFDSFALDIEASLVKPASKRTVRLLRLSKKIRAAVGSGYPLGAIIPSPVGMQMHSSYWPGFPYRPLALIYNVMVPMGYYTYHGNGYANAYSDTRNNIRIIRQKTKRSTEPIHVIAGVANKSSASETRAFVRALRENGCIGGSMYDWATCDSTDWRILAYVRYNPVERPALPRTVGYLKPLGYCSADRTHPKEVFYQADALDSDMVLRYRLFDAQKGEIHLSVNWHDLGALKAGPRGSWTGVREVVIPATSLNAKGRNVFGFVAPGSSPPWHRWGVRDVTLSAD
jgi:hypothetical protein